MRQIRYRRLRRRKRRMPRRAAAAFFLLFVTAGCFGILRWADGRLRAQLHALAAAQAAATQEHAMTNAVLSALSGVETQSLVHVLQNSDGQVVSIQTDAISVNRLKGQIALAAGAALASPRHTVRIPFGSLTGLDLLAGRGLKIPVPVQTAGFASAQIQSEFDDAGINQTRHRLTLNVHAELTVSMPHMTRSLPMQYDVCIAETIIVGTVPDVYANMNHGE